MKVNSERGAARLAALVVATGVLLGGAANAHDAASVHDDQPPAIELMGGQGARAFHAFQVSIGVRSAFFGGAGYDPFSTNDIFVQPGIMATWALRTGPRFMTAVGATFETGAQDALARGADAGLSLRRLAAVIEERFAPRPWAYAFARLSPGWLHGGVSLADAATPAPLETSFDGFSLDGSLGGAVRVTPSPARASVWVVADAGYGWAATQRLALAPALPGADRDKAGVTTLSDLAPRGVFYRIALAIGF